MDAQKTRQEEILRGKQMTLGQWVYNSETSQCFGRTGTSWGKIFIFYVAYYLFLAGFFSICMFLFYQTLDTELMPKYTPGNDDSILRNPSLGFRPRPPMDNIESSMIRYSKDKEFTYSPWVKSLNDLIKGKEESKKVRDYTVIKPPRDNIIYCNTTHGPDLKAEVPQVCNYDITFLGDECTEGNKWGYNSDSPCIVLKLNRMYGWEPKVFEKLEELPKDMPDQLKEKIKEETTNNEVPKVLWVSCDGESPLDREMLGSLDSNRGVTYFPSQGFPDYYFPYTNQDNYKSPLIAVRFNKPTPNILINILCKIWGKEIKYDKKGGIGMVHFELLRESKTG